MQNQIKEAQLSLSTVHRILRCFSKNDREIEPVVLHTINPHNSTKWIFHFSLIDFSKKILDKMDLLAFDLPQKKRTLSKIS